MVLAPRQHFQQQVEAAKFHRDLVVTDRFREALHASLLEQVMALPDTLATEEAAAAYHRIIGARAFVAHLLNIAEGKKAPAELPQTNLNHRP